VAVAVATEAIAAAVVAAAENVAAAIAAKSPSACHICGHHEVAEPSRFRQICLGLKFPLDPGIS
jgi:hypothetical protein